jgi:predicted ribosome quality control (RQC) complex YloA/Tae2 family protein
MAGVAMAPLPEQIDARSRTPAVTDRRRSEPSTRGVRSEDAFGFSVLVGKAGAENDTLTFGIAAPRDFWLHVSGCPGSHVVVRNPDNLSELPRLVLQRAGELAAWHSKARTRRGKVEVHVCRVADVSKRRGAPAGEVQLRRFDILRVYPRGSEADAAVEPPPAPAAPPPRNRRH